MNERIKELRKALQLNHTEFGSRIGVKQTTVAGYENGTRIPLDAVISSILPRVRRKRGLAPQWRGRNAYKKNSESRNSRVYG